MCKIHIPDWFSGSHSGAIAFILLSLLLNDPQGHRVSRQTEQGGGHIGEHYTEEHPIFMSKHCLNKM